MLCEKPLTRVPRWSSRPSTPPTRADRVLMEAFMWRFHPQTDELVRLVREGAVGDVRYVHAAFAFGGHRRRERAPADRARRAAR